MPIELQCPSCGKHLKAPEAQAGRSGRCPRCKSELQIPLVPMAHGRSSTAGGEAATLELLDTGLPELPPRVDTTRPPPLPVGVMPLGASPTARSPLDDSFEPAGATDLDRAADDETIDPKQWHGLRLALRTTELALLVVSISCGMVSLPAVGIAIMSNASRPDMVTAQILSILMMWGGVGAMCGWVALFTGWLVCLAAWPKRDRRLVLAAAWSAGVSVFAIMILISLGILGVFGQPYGATGGLPPQAIIVIGSIASAASLILFNFFLTSIRRRLGQFNVETQPIIYAAVIGTLTLWCLVCNLWLAPEGAIGQWIVMLSNVATYLLQFIWLWLINAFVSRDIRVSHAWNRL